MIMEALKVKFVCWLTLEILNIWYCNFCGYITWQVKAVVSTKNQHNRNRQKQNRPHTHTHTPTHPHIPPPHFPHITHSHTPHIPTPPPHTHTNILCQRNKDFYSHNVSFIHFVCFNRWKPFWRQLRKTWRIFGQEELSTASESPAPVAREIPTLSI